MLQILIRKKQYFNAMAQPFYWVGANPASLTAIQGYIPNNNWLDITSNTVNVDDLVITFTRARDDSGEERPGVTFIDRTASESLKIEGAGYDFIRAWIIDNVSATLNSIEVKIIDKDCDKSYDNWVITRGQIEWCENEICEFSVTLKQGTDVFHCIQRTLVNDNWQGWFQTEPKNGKKHPRFSYCNEVRPNGMLVMQWYVAMSSLSTNGAYLFPIILLLNSIFFGINIVIAIINAASSILGGSTTVIQPIALLDPNDILEGLAEMFIESGGCGREHPAPLIRDYISNVCLKCGVAVDEITAPIFYAKTITINTSQGIKKNEPNPYYNACYFYAPYLRGIRRFKNINLITGYTQHNDTDYYIYDNAPDIALSDFLDTIKGAFNADWHIRNVNGIPTLYFWRKDWFMQLPPVYDFRLGQADRLKIVEGICFEAREIKFPASVDGFYSPDVSDTCGNEATRAMNGYAYAFDATENNPNYEGLLQTKSEYLAATKFRLDGHAKDYLFDAAQIVLNGTAVMFLATSIFNPFGMFVVGDIFKRVLRHARDYADYGLLLKDETCELAKILIWDGVDYANAKCVKTKRPHPASPTALPMPVPNTRFNTKQWDQLHTVDVFVRGQNLSFASTPAGVYMVKDYFGFQYAYQPAVLVNFPMYFNPGYLDTLWDWFWWVEDPVSNPKLGIDWSVKIELCCDDLEKVGVANDALQNVLGYPIKLPFQYYDTGKITTLVVSYKSADEVGKYIEIKGEL